MKFYGIRNKTTKIPLTFRIDTGDDGALSFAFVYTKTPDKVWLVPNKPSSLEFNVGTYESPFHGRVKLAEFEVFKVNV